jgi:hypothetical protein
MIANKGTTNISLFDKVFCDDEKYRRRKLA